MLTVCSGTYYYTVTMTFFFKWIAKYMLHKYIF